MSKIFETHAHYDDEAFDEDREELINRLLKDEVFAITNIGADVKSSENSVELSKKFDRIIAVVGVHPDEISCLENGGFERIAELAENPKVVAIGEIGLDYFDRYVTKDEKVKSNQKYWLSRQLELAGKLGLPVVIHSRDAAEDTYEVLKASGINKGVIHCYSYSPEMADKFVKLGFYIGIGGVLTFKNAKKIKETVEHIGIEHIVLETDSPYLAPVPNRGKRNDSGNIKYVVNEISAILNIPTEQIIDVTFNNALRLYNLEDKYGKLS